MELTTEQQQFLYAFYEVANQKAPDNLVEIVKVAQHCGMDASQGEAITHVLADAGFLEPKGLSPSSYRLTPKGRLEVRHMFRHPDTRGELSPRATISMSTLGTTTAGTQLRLGSEDRNAILSALTFMKQSLTTVDSVAGHAPDHVCDVITELEGELHKPAPNLLRLRGLLMGLSIATHMAGDNEPLDHEVKVALSFLGIDVL